MSRSALATGAARDIGGAVAERLTADGWAVHAVDVDDGDVTTRDGNRAVVASPFKAGYGADKHGVLGLVKVPALENAAVGISVSALCPEDLGSTAR